jgi:glutathione-regulated potassium-efflux system protein KefB
MMLDLDVIAAQPGLIIGLAATLVVVKTAIIFGLGRLFGLNSTASLVMALLLSQGGEFGFVLFAASQSALLIEPEAASLFGAVVTLSMATTPFLMILAGRLANRQRQSEVALEDPELAERANVIIVGHGRFGQTVSQIMQAAGRTVTLIDVRPETIDVSNEFGRKVFYGDGTRIDLLHRAGADEACAIFFCMDDREVTAESLMPVRETFPNAKLFVRAYDRRQAIELMPEESLNITRELFESSIKMAENALVSLNVAATVREQALAEFRRRDLARLQEQYRTGNMHAGSQHSFGGGDSADFVPDEG